MNSRGVRSSLGFGGDFPAAVEAHLARWRHRSAAAPARAPLHSKPRRWDGTRRATPALYGLYRPASVAFPARTHCRWLQFSPTLGAHARQTEKGKELGVALYGRWNEDRESQLQEEEEDGKSKSFFGLKRRKKKVGESLDRVLTSSRRPRLDPPPLFFITSRKTWKKSCAICSFNFREIGERELGGCSCVSVLSELPFQLVGCVPVSARCVGQILLDKICVEFVWNLPQRAVFRLGWSWGIWRICSLSRFIRYLCREIYKRKESIPCSAKSIR